MTGCLTGVVVLRAQADRLWAELAGTRRMRERLVIYTALRRTYVAMARHERAATGT